MCKTNMIQWHTAQIRVKCYSALSHLGSTVHVYYILASSLLDMSVFYIQQIKRLSYFCFKMARKKSTDTISSLFGVCNMYLTHSRSTKVNVVGHRKTTLRYVTTQNHQFTVSTVLYYMYNPTLKSNNSGNAHVKWPEGKNKVLTAEIWCVQSTWDQLAFSLTKMSPSIKWIVFLLGLPNIWNKQPFWISKIIIRKLKI